LVNADRDEFLEITKLVGMNKPLHVRRLQRALHEYAKAPDTFLVGCVSELQRQGVGSSLFAAPQMFGAQHLLATTGSFPALAATAAATARLQPSAHIETSALTAGSSALQQTPQRQLFTSAQLPTMTEASSSLAAVPPIYRPDEIPPTGWLQQSAHIA
jgi:hypothetical protein